MFDALDESIRDAVSVVTSPSSGIATQIADNLGALDVDNPFGTIIDVIADNSAYSSILSIDSLVGLADTLLPPIPITSNGGGVFADWSKQTGGAVINWVQDGGEAIADWAEEGVDDVLETEAVAYKVETVLDLSINLVNGSIYADATLGPGLSYDLRKLKELSLGEASLPDFEPLEAVESLYGMQLKKTTDYETVKAQQQSQFGAQNVYFASSRFAEYFGTETLAEVVAEALVIGGQDTLKETAEQLRLELNEVLAFLTLKGEAELANLGANVLNAILNQTDLIMPHVELRWTPVTYRYDLEPTGLFGQVYDAIADQDAVVDLLGDRPLSVDSRHAAFTVIWKPANVPNPIDPAWIDLQLRAAVDEFDVRELSAPPMDVSMTNLVIDELEAMGAPRGLLDLAELVLGRVNDVGELEAEFAGFLSDRLDISEPELRAAYSTGKGTLDLGNTPIADGLKSALDNVTFGNMGEVEVDSLKFDISSYTLTAKITLCHKHSWGSVGDVLDAIGL